MAEHPPSAGKPRYAEISLGQGWNGRVLTGHDPIGSTENVIVSLTMDQWREWLQVLIRDHRHMSGLKVLKASESVGVLEAQLPRAGTEKSLRVVCKQSRVRGVKDGMTSLFRSSAARRNFEKATALHKSGIQTAIPLAYMERRSPRASWLVTEFLDGVIDLDAYVLTVLSRAGAAASRSRRNLIIRTLAELFRGLERAGLYHRDMKASNILLSHLGDPAILPRGCIVDLDGLAVHRPWRSAWKPIVRLAASLMQYPAVTRTEYARFLREYLVGDGQVPGAWRTQFHGLRKQAARYSQAAHGRKSNKLDGFSG